LSGFEIRNSENPENPEKNFAKRNSLFVFLMYFPNFVGFCVIFFFLHSDFMSDERHEKSLLSGELFQENF